jgi:molecular chaperone HscB
VSDDPFEVLGLAARFDLEPQAVRRAFLARAAAVHPDHAAGEDSADEASAALNRAKAALENPERRANALLERLGGPGKREDRSLPAGFLMQIMETREEIEGALATRDPASRARWEAWAQEQRGEYGARVGKLFKDFEMSKDAATLRAIREELNAWRYIERLIEQLDPDYDPARRDLAD